MIGAPLSHDRIAFHADLIAHIDPVVAVQIDIYTRFMAARGINTARAKGKLNALRLGNGSNPEYPPAPLREMRLRHGSRLSDECELPYAQTAVHLSNTI